MTVKEAIDYLERCADGCDPTFDEAVAMAIVALRAWQEATSQHPCIICGGKWAVADDSGVIATCTETCERLAAYVARQEVK